MAEEYGAVDLSTFKSGHARSGSGTEGARTAGAAARAGTTGQSSPANGRPAGADSPGHSDGSAAATPGAESKQLPGEYIREADDQTFDEIMQLSLQVPVVVDLWATWCGPCKQLGPVLEDLAQEYAGRFCLVKVDVDQSPALAQAFQAQSIPTVVALLGGRPVPLFQGAQPKAQIRPILDQLLEIAGQAGITAVLAGGSEAAEIEPELSPEEKEIQELTADGNLTGAIERAERALRNNPAEKAKFQYIVDQLRLQQRLQVEKADGVDETDPFTLADQFFAAGNKPQAFQILLEQVASHHGEEREPFRERLIELFRLSDDASDAVKEARQKLTRLLF